MKTCFWFQATAIRADYSAHVLRADREGFKPLTLDQFGNGFARCHYLINRAGPIGAIHRS